MSYTVQHFRETAQGTEVYTARLVGAADFERIKDAYLSSFPGFSRETPENRRLILDDFLEKLETGKPPRIFLFRGKYEDEVLGYLTLLINEDRKGSEVNYGLLNNDARGKLLMPLLFSAATQFALAQGYEYLDAYIIPENQRSQKTAKRWGFKQQGKMKERYVLDLDWRSKWYKNPDNFCYDPK
jgi:RimJ/RimL family protein N-acetyltransferase